MTSFNIHNDDAGLLIRPTVGRTVKEVQAYPDVHAIQEDETATEAPKQNKHDEQRRKRGRRQKNTEVLLDTRSGHDRRNAASKESSETENETTDTTPASGINVYT